MGAYLVILAMGMISFHLAMLWTWLMDTSQQCRKVNPVKEVMEAGLVALLLFLFQGLIYGYNSGCLVKSYLNPHFIGFYTSNGYLEMGQFWT